MLYLSLVLSLILLVIANLIVWRPGKGKRNLAIFAISGSTFTFAPCSVATFLPPVALLYLFLLVLLLRWDAHSNRRWLFLPLSCVATVVAFGIPGLFVWAGQLEFFHLRRQFPYESMEERVPAPRPAFLGKQFPKATAERLNQLEEFYQEEPRELLRVRYLRKLHEEKVNLFTESPGFGMTRMFRFDRPSEAGIKYGLRPENHVPEPVPRAFSAISASEIRWDLRDGEEDLIWVHRQGVRDFVNVEGFGFIRDRRHVAGFQAHQFSQVPGPASQWVVQTLDLVGLLLHDEPLAYVSAELPRMDELRKAPTRLLDHFEASALERLRQGEDLVVGDTPTSMRMLGSIRSTRQCVKCHDGARGDLLGAFSYTLRPGER
jgi:hypothetical protein